MTKKKEQPMDFRNVIWQRLVLVAFALGALGCSSESITPLGTFSPNEFKSLAEVNADFCTLPANAAKSQLKFIFLLDKSGSNQVDPGTDKYGMFRYDSIARFVAGGQDDPTISYSLMNFSDPSVNWAGSNSFWKSRADFSAHIRAEKYRNAAPTCQVGDVQGCPFDAGWTDYNNALSRLRDKINEDISAARTIANAGGPIVSSYYVVFMLSDGAPIYGRGPDGDLRQDTECYDTVTGERKARCGIFDNVDGIINMGISESNRDFVEGIQLHSLFYYDPSSTISETEAARALRLRAIELLRDMAVYHGKGNSLSLSTGEVLDFNVFSIPVRNVKHSLKDVFVVNENAIWWQGILKRDLDGDGLPDDIETQLGSNPSEWDSDKNGVGDGIEYKVYGKPCADAQCNSARARDVAQACGSPVVGLPNGQKFADYDGDFLNNCEEQVVLHSNFVTWDTNHDWIPDDIAVRFGFSYTQGLIDHNLDPDGDGIRNYDEAKFFTPPYYPDNLIPGIKRYQYDVRQTSDSATETCYRINVRDVSMMTEADLIRVYVTEGTSFIDDKSFLRTAEKRVSTNEFGQNVVTLEKGDFK